MGKVVADELKSNNEMKVTCGFDRQENLDYSFPVYNNTSKIKEKIDVIIDFSHVNMTIEILKFAKDKNIPIVIATTGFNNEQEEFIKDCSKIIPIFKSANMSFDINLMCKIVAKLAQHLADSDIEITETHHRNKVDAPSGTALLLANSINGVLTEKKDYVFDRHSRSCQRGNNEIGFSSIRGGNIVGEHTVQFFGPYETFEIKHTSYSRSVFADGAIKAGSFIIGKDVGMYSMDDLVEKIL